MPLHYRHGFHSRLANLNGLLRYPLGCVVTSYNRRLTQTERGLTRTEYVAFD